MQLAHSVGLTVALAERHAFDFRPGCGSSSFLFIHVAQLYFFTLLFTHFYHMQTCLYSAALPFIIANHFSAAPSVKSTRPRR